MSVFLLFLSLDTFAQRRAAPPARGPKPPPMQKFKKDVFFGFGKHILDDSAKIILHSILDSIQLYQSWKVEIYGNTDAVGDSLKNIELSAKRSNNVKKYFTDSLGKDTNIQIITLGESKPIADNETEEGRRLNRRVEIVIQYVRRPPPVENWCKPVLCCTTFLNPITTFCIMPDRDTVLRAANGTILMIAKGTFQGYAKTKKGQEPRCIEVQVRELLNPSDMVRENVSTRVNDQYFGNTGAIYLTGMQDGKALTVKRGKKIGVLIPLEKEMDNASKVFEGMRDKMEQPVTWALSKKDAATKVRTSGLDNYLSFDCVAEKRCPLFFCKIARALGLKKKNKGTCCPPADSACVRVENTIRSLMFQNYDKKKEAAYMKTAGVNWHAQLRENVRAGGKLSSAYTFYSVGKTGYTGVLFPTNTKGKNIALKLNGPSEEKTEYYLILKEGNKVMPRFTDKKDFFKDAIVPEGKEATIVAIKAKDGKMYLSMTDITTGAGPITLNFAEATQETCVEKLKALDALAAETQE